MAEGEVVYSTRADNSQLDGDLNQAEKKIDSKFSKIGSAAGKAAKATGAAFAAVGTAALAVGTKAVTGAVDFDKAMNQFAASTGTAESELAAYEDTLKSLYTGNYGESYEDIADAMAKVTQQMGELDQADLQNVTEGIYTLSGVFGSDFNETLRGVDQLMTQFGISAEDALDLLAAGSQQGLDYTDELGDNISEYAGKFSQAGYTAEEYFQLLKNGTESGSYNLDKVNDSINEITNRLADGTIGQSLEQFSSGTKKVFAEWQRGEASQKDVIDAIVKDINTCTNEQQALTMAATAFGTMGEDANLDFIKSLSSVGEAFDTTKGKMEKMKAVKYDDLGSMLEGLGRTIEALLLPLGDGLIPLIQQIAESLLPMFEENLPLLTELIGGLAESMLPVVEALLPPLLDLISQLMPIFLQAIEEILPPLIGLIETLLPPLMELAETLLPPLISLFGALIEPLAEILGAVLPPLIEVLDALIQPLMELIEQLLPPLTELLHGLTPVFDALAPLIQTLADLFGGVLSGALELVMPILDELMNILDGLITFISGVFSGDWEKAWDGIVEVFRGIFNLIPSIIEGVLNGGITLINNIIKGINKLTGVVGIPEIPLIPKLVIPRFHAGGVVDFEAGGEGLALLKDGEMVLTQAQQAQLFALAASGGSAPGSQTVVVTSPVYLDGRLISRNVTQHQYTDVMVRRYK